MTMALSLSADNLPPQMSLAPTSDNRGIPYGRDAPQAYDAPPTKSTRPPVNGSQPGLLRPLTVNEALQYSPFSSIVPFDSGIIPSPNADVNTSQPIFLTQHERQASRQQLEQIDRSIIQGQGHSRLAEQTLKDVRILLKSSKVSTFKFKQTSRLKNIASAFPTQPLNDRFKGSQRLGPFANMVVKATDISYEYAPRTPESIASRPRNPSKAQLPQHSTSPKLSVAVIAPRLSVKNRKAYDQNAKVTIKDESFSSQQQQKLYPSVVIPPLHSSDSLSQYVTHRQPPITSPSKKRKRDDDDGTRAQTKDQRAVSNAALYALQELISEIFEAENAAELSGMSAAALASNTMFVMGNGSDGETLTLGATTQAKLEVALHKAISLGRFADIPVEHLVHLQQLCKGAISSTEGTDIGIRSGLTDGDVSGWLERVELVDAGLRATRTALRIMTGGREEQQLYSEEMLQKIVDLPRMVLESCIVPVVECRSTGSQAEMFETAASHKKVILSLLQSTSKIMQLLLDLLGRIELSETTIISIEYFMIQMLFIENSHSEKESVLGIHRFENFRRVAMNIIAEIFSRNTDQRKTIFDEVLISLQKLPTTRQHARQFKLGDGKSMQLVSALLMRLVQTSGMHCHSGSSKKSRRALPAVRNGGSTAASEEDDSQSDPSGSEHESEAESSDDGNSAPKGGLSHQLVNRVKTLHESAISDARHVIQFFVNRASTSSKTGDQPHRHLLDIFAEDLVTVLGQPEWPASELLLRALVTKMNHIAKDDKSTAPAKNMALEMLGMMGSAISDIVSGARALTRSLENDGRQLSSSLIQLFDDQMGNDIEPRALYSWTGPYRTVMEYLGQNNVEPQTTSAKGYYLTQWAKLVIWGNQPTSEPFEAPGTNQQYGDLAVRVCKLVAIGKFTSLDDFESVSNLQCRLAYLLIINSMGFCRAFGHILKTLIDSVGSDQITVRTRSLKSVTQMLEKDPTLLDRTPQVVGLIVKCASDQSSMVRDSALTLIGKCVLLKPSLELDVLKTVLSCSSDAAVGIRKRSMKLLKDIYLRNPKKDIRTFIADSLLQRIQDVDDGAADLARLIFEDIWLSPFWTSAGGGEHSAHDQVLLKEQVSLLINTIQRGEKVSLTMHSLLSFALSSKSKNRVANSIVCRAMVDIAFNGIIDITEIPGSPSQQSILETLVVFARASPKLFTQQQLEHLQPYIQNLSIDDIHLFRSVVIVLRCVLPTIPSVQKESLISVQAALLKSVSKLAKAELNEVVACLWTINGELGNVDILVNLVASVLGQLQKVGQIIFSSTDHEKEVSRTKRLLYLAGHFTKYCDFQPQMHKFQTKFSWWQGASVSGTIVSTLLPFAAEKQPLELRTAAIENIGLICQAWPKNFNLPDIVRLFQTILRTGDHVMQKIVLLSFRDFFSSQDQHVATALSDERDPLAKGKLGGSMTASDNDGAAALIAQGFLKDVVQIATSSQDAYALAATEVMASITRQGLVHPKECGPALVALETSTNPKIAEVAYQQHQALHLQHESMFEREYMRALHEAFIYQRDIVENSNGFVGSPYKSKLHLMYEVVKTSKGKYQTKFLTNFCMRIDFDVTKLDLSSKPPAHLEYARFLIENLAFFEYGRVEDLLHAISCMERIVAGTGAGIAHAINTEILNMTLEAALEAATEGTEASAEPPAQVDRTWTREIEPLRLLQLTTASAILSMLWEARTFVRRLHGINGTSQKREARGKGSKDLTKAPAKVHGITGDRLVESIGRLARSLDSRELSLSQCKEFAELMAVDNEVKVAAESDEADDGRLQTPGMEDDNDSASNPASGGGRNAKRKGSASLGGTPNKKRGRPSLGPRKGNRRSVDDEHWD